VAVVGDALILTASGAELQADNLAVTDTDPRRIEHAAVREFLLNSAHSYIPS
jgi:hypothetical protein